MYDLTGFQRDLLYITAGQDESRGVAIKDELEQSMIAISPEDNSTRISTHLSKKDSSRKARSTAERTPTESLNRDAAKSTTAANGNSSTSLLRLKPN